MENASFGLLPRREARRQVFGLRRYIQIRLAIFFAIFVMIILIHPAVDLPNGTRPCSNLAVFLLLLATVIVVTYNPALSTDPRIITLREALELFPTPCANSFPILC